MVSGILPRKHDGRAKLQKLAGLVVAIPRHRETPGPSARSIVRMLHEPGLCHVHECILEHCSCAEHMHVL